MNWQAGILAFILFWVPMIAIYIIMCKRDREIKQAYIDEMTRIRKQYGIE